ncbi:MAG: chemotaxis protein CheA [Candidatus Riflebacteria bacterium]|nr:chemotaxis protein CheA [Candidatus Riflebacteria bacterium]
MALLFSESERGELLQGFLAESIEHLEGIEHVLLQIESASAENRDELTNQVFRAAHSIKGGSAMLGLTTIQALAHKTESVLDFLRSGTLTPNSDLIDLLLRSFDTLRHLIDHSQHSDTTDISANLASLEAVIARAQQETTPEGPSSGSQGPGQVTTEPGEPLPEKAEPTLRVRVRLLEDLMNLAGELVLSRNQLREALGRSDLRAIRISGQRMGQVTTELQETIMMTRLQPLDRVFSKFPRMIRDLSKQLSKDIQVSIEGREVELDKTLIEGLGDPLTHMVRNAADHGVESPEERTRLGKRNPARVRLQAYYEAGQVVIEVADDGRGIDGEKVAQKALARGLVSPDKARKLSMKEKQALIFLPGLSTAETVTDLSGRGVGMDVVKTNIDRLGGKVEIDSEPGKGTSFRVKLPLTLAIIPSLILSTCGEIFAIPQVNVLEMLMVPAEQVKRRIEVIDRQEVLVLRGKLLPLVSLNEFLGATHTFVHPLTQEEQTDRRHRLADRRSTHHDRPLAGLPATPAHAAEHPRTDGRRHRACSNLNIVIATTGNFSFGIVVDKLLFTEEIVVKQLGRDLKGLPEYSGATIMGDGRIALIIDVLGLATRANLLGQAQALSQEAAEPVRCAKSDGETVPFLAFQYGGPETLVLPLYMVTRLEKIRPGDIGECGGWKAIPYGDHMLPVFLLSDIGRIPPLRPDQERGVIVLRVRGREVGLVAALPIQVLQIRPDFDGTVLRQPGIAGSRVWNQKTVMLVDIWEILETQHPELLEIGHQSPLRRPDVPQIVVLEPVTFFQRQLRLQLESQGFQVTVATSWPEVENHFAVPQARCRALLADVTLLQQDRYAGLRHFRSTHLPAGLPIVGLRQNEPILPEELAAEGVGEVFQKLDHQPLAVWIDALRTGTGVANAAADSGGWQASSCPWPPAAPPPSSPNGRV